MMATLSINIKRMKEWYKEKKIFQQMNINLKTDDPNSKSENSEDQGDSVSLHTIGHFGNFCPESLSGSLLTFKPTTQMKSVAFHSEPYQFFGF